ncbi:MAG: transcription antitermination factor NusB [Candidatus Pacebacteria bacterium]|nr:transcription antitermination factor NusB [Candidatus Paceibacterota bacterium]
MSTRHIARTLALQTLFELDMQESLSADQEKIASILDRNREEFGEGVKDMSFAKGIITSALSRRITIDDIITRAAPDWPLDKIGTVDRNVLRIGLAELLFGDRAQVPPKVAIDEAIELAKAYGGETSGRFVNGVLGAIYKEMGEPEKAQVTKPRSDDTSNAKREVLAGAVIYSNSNNKNHLALVHDVFGYWTLPKGHIQKEENEEEGLMREIKKEVGLDIVIVEKIGENEYIANKPEVGKIIKHVSYYLVSSMYTPLVLENKGGLDEAKWFPVDEIPSLRMYDDIKPLIQKALTKI